VTPEHDVETAGTTTIVVCEDFDPIVAVITADPVATPVTSPDATVAMDGAELCHVAVVPAMVAPEPSRPNAVSVVICPTAIVLVGALIWTDTSALGAVVREGAAASPPPHAAQRSSRHVRVYRMD
jgi:hypothetical protein